MTGMDWGYIGATVLFFVAFGIPFVVLVAKMIEFEIEWAKRDHD